MQLRLSLRAALPFGAAVGVLSAAACSDPFQPVAQLDTSADAFVLFALTGASSQLPSGVELTGPTAVRPGVTTQNEPAGLITRPTFDIAFNIDAAGRVQLYPPRTLLSSNVAARRVGFRRVATSFDSLRAAPNGGFRYDSVFTVSPGETIVVESQAGSCSSTTPLAAKLVVDSVSAASRAIFVRVRSNPNCGFRSLLPGRPER
jgi:hypothetical protein